MGSIAELKENINNQFISIFDSVLFIAKHGKGTPKDGFNLLKTKILKKQIYLFLIDDYFLTEVRFFQDDYEAVEYEGQYITATFILSELEKSIANNKATSSIQTYGFGLKRFYNTVQNDLGIIIPDSLFLKALSPDCYHDEENPLTLVVKELQAENALLKQSQTTTPAQSEPLSENYIMLNEAIAHLTKSLDFSIINPINFLERGIKQGLIIPYFEFSGFIQFETRTDKFSVVIQIDEVHGYFKDWQYRQPDNQFTDLSKDTYSLLNGGRIEKLFFSCCSKFYGRYYDGNEHYEPNEAIQPEKDLTVTFYNLMPAFRDYNEIIRHKNDTETINKRAIHFKISELETLINQNSHLKISSEGQQIADLTAQLASLQADNDRLTAENKRLNEALANKPAPTVTDGEQISNVELVNSKQNIIATHNNLLGKALKSLDCDKVLTKNDIARFIHPYMQEMAESIGGKAVELSTITKDHLSGIEFKEGSPTKANKEKTRISLIFDRTKITATTKE